MADQESLVIVGAGLAGAKAAEGARGAGFGGRITLVGDEPGLPYERPPLSKNVLRGDDPPETANVHKEEWYTQQDIELVHGRVESLDVNARSVRVANGGGSSSNISFTAAVLATGGRARKLNVPGANRDGVHYLRAKHDSVQLGDAIRNASRVCVIGGGWIGSEVAASARQMGANVVIVDNGPVLLGRVMGQRVGEVFQGLHQQNGVEVRNNARVVELAGSQKVEGVALAGDGVIEADLVVVGIGAEMNLDLAINAGLKTEDNGVLADEFLQTDAQGVYVAGDIANALHPFYSRRVRVEHWDNALNQGKRAGQNIGGDRRPYENLPYFYTDQFDLGMEYVGMADPEADVAIRGDLEERKFIAFWHKGGVVTSAMNVNVWDVVDDLRNIIHSQKAIDVAKLEDAEVDLKELG